MYYLQKQNKREKKIISTMEKLMLETKKLNFFVGVIFGLFGLWNKSEDHVGASFFEKFVL